MGTAGKKILVIGLLALGVAVPVMLLRHLDSSPMEIAPNPDLEAPQTSPGAVQGGTTAAPKPPAFRVELATVPGAAKLPSIATLGQAGSKMAGHNMPPIPQAVNLANAAMAYPTETAEAPGSTHSDLEIAMHPSLKYSRNGLEGAGIRSAAAVDVPIVSLKMHPGVPAATARPDSATAAAGRLNLINANLKMEEDRRFVMSMCQDNQGRLWVGTEGGGVQRFDPSAPELHQWTQFTTKDGLGDDNGYAIACDHVGRIWVGHLNHGVSVFNGEKWQNYEVVGGLSRPDSLDGPLGERIFNIKVCPTDGDVWMCTSLGLARYSNSKDEWTYFTRAEGLPSDQANAIAFDRDGNIYAATQCDGIALAASAGGYKSWRVAAGSEEAPTVPRGDGLPTNSTNDVLVASDNTIYAATIWGLAWSKDRGQSWKYVRGADWADKVRGRYGGMPPGWIETPSATLSEDYSTCLFEDSSGILLIGHRQQGCDVLDARSSQDISPYLPSSLSRADFVTSFCSLSDSHVALGTYGHGVASGPGTRFTIGPTRSLGTARHADFPSPAHPLGNHEIFQRVAEGRSMPLDALKGIYLGDDWATQGDWVGRYGRQFAILFGASSPFDDYITDEMHYSVESQIGPNAMRSDGLRRWLRSLYSANGSSLWDPCAGCRRQGEIDDHGEAYSPAREGPDLRIKVLVPDGVHTISLYFENDDGHQGGEVRRDFLIQLKDASPTANSEGARLLASARVQDFWNGVYKQFLVRGPGQFLFTVLRGSSLNTICSGAMIDQCEGPDARDKRFHPWMGNINYNKPDLDDVFILPPCAELWDNLDDSAVHAKPLQADRQLRILSYRATARSSDSSPDVLANWRWRLHLWSPADRAAFANTMAACWVSVRSLNSQLK